MSYDIDIVDDQGKVMHARIVHQIRGGTYCAHGTTELTLNITYNYAPYYYRAFGENGIRSLYGRPVIETLTDIANAIIQIGRMTDVELQCKFRFEECTAKQVEAGLPVTHTEWDTRNYWIPTRDNAKAALQNLLTLAALGPEGTWSGD